jgi:hypothetical protein
MLSVSETSPDKFKVKPQNLKVLLVLPFELKIRSFAGAQDDAMDGALAEIISCQKITANAVLLNLFISIKFVLSHINQIKPIK